MKFIEFFFAQAYMGVIVKCPIGPIIKLTKPTPQIQMKHLTGAKSQKGFSLVELLVVIAVIGIIAAIAIPAMSGIFGQADAAADKRNAQAIVSTFNAARAAGNQKSYDKAAAISAIVAGTNGGGTFTNSLFQAPVAASETTAVSALISGLASASTSGLLTTTF
jgi:type IV pilus assembly protein PilA